MVLTVKEKTQLFVIRGNTLCFGLCSLIIVLNITEKSLVPFFFTLFPQIFIYINKIPYQAFYLSKSFMQKTCKIAISLHKLLMKDLDCGKRQECLVGRGRRRGLCQDSKDLVPVLLRRIGGCRHLLLQERKLLTCLVSGIFASPPSVIFPSLFNHSMFMLQPKGPWETGWIYLHCRQRAAGLLHQWWMSRCPGIQCHHQDFTC